MDFRPTEIERSKVLEEIASSFDKLAAIGISAGFIAGAVYPESMNHFNDLMVNADLSSEWYRN